MCTHWRFRWEQWQAIPPQIRVRKLWRSLGRTFPFRSQRSQYAPPPPAAARLSIRIQTPPREYLEPYRPELLYWWQHVEQGEWSVFLPCWKRLPTVAYPRFPLGPEASPIVRLLPEGRLWLDWQRDIVTGYRWDEGEPSRRLLRILPSGSDPKVPWEIGRLQIMPALAVLALLEPTQAVQLRQWFQQTVLDFLVQNPPGRGIQWASPLEVAIRSFSILLTAGLFRAQQPLGAPFEHVLLRGLLEHGYFLMHHLEWNAGLRGNHYIGNVVGLLSLGAALPEVPIAPVWLAFGIGELGREVLQQFLPDGGHWEGSTYYHRFVLEMVLAGTALAVGLSPEQRRAVMTASPELWKGERPLPSIVGDPSAPGWPFPPEYWERVRAAIHFAAAVAKPSGCAPQIGDHDSGRWLKLIPRAVPLTPAQAQTYELPEGCSVAELVEEHRDIRPTLGLAAALCRACPAEWRQQPEAWLFPNFPLLEIQEPKAVECFPEFGLVVYRWGDFFLAVRCGGLEQLHPSGGHAHCDQLSIELSLGCSDVLVDPGTYCYTASPRWRNVFRSTAAHNTVVAAGIEQFRFFEHTAEALFWLFRSGVRVRLLEVQPRAFAGEFLHPRYRHRRLLRMLPDGVEGIDLYEGAVPAACHFHMAPEVGIEPWSATELLCHTPEGLLHFWSSAPVECQPGVFSAGYYVRQRTTCIRLPLERGEARWWIRRR